MNRIEKDEITAKAVTCIYDGESCKVKAQVETRKKQLEFSPGSESAGFLPYCYICVGHKIKRELKLASARSI